MLARFVLTAAPMFPDTPYHRREHGLPPGAPMPSMQIPAEVASPRCAPDEHRQTKIAAGLVQKSVDQTGFLLLAKFASPQVIERTLFDDASRRKISARQGITDAETKEVVLETGGFADKSGLSVDRASSRRRCLG